MNLDRSSLLLVAHLIDEIVDALELWQLAGDGEWRWVGEFWTRRITPWIGLDLPSPVRAAADAATLHRALLVWQGSVIDILLSGQSTQPTPQRSPR